MRPLVDRFWEKVKKTRGCWEWTASKTWGGYGHMRDGNRRMALAHRVSWFLEYGEWPVQLDHLCRNRGCVRLSHLEEVTPRENVLRGNGQGGINARKTHCLRGHIDWVVTRGACGPARYCRTCRRIRYLKGRKKHAKQRM